MEGDGRPNLGGMENAFSIKIMRRLIEYFAGRLHVDLIWTYVPAKQTKKGKQACSRSGDRILGAWDILPNELLGLVLMKLNVIDFLAFRGVCRSWRSASIDICKRFLERQQPLVVAKPKYSKKACVLYNMFDEKSWKTMLPNLPCKKLLGLSCGYLITIDRHIGFWLVNLITRHELHFPFLPASMHLSESIGEIYDFKVRAALFRSSHSSRVFMILFSRDHNILLLSESGASSWQEYRLPNTRSGISDVKILDGKIFILTCDGLFGEFNPRSEPVLKLYNIKIPLQLSSQLYLQLVTSEKKIYTIVSRRLSPYLLSVRYTSLYELDYKMESVNQINELGSKSLFLSPFNSALVDTTDWGAGNCVCVLEPISSKECVFYHLNGNKLATIPIVWECRLTPYFWYFLSESWDISCAGDEFGT
ncbi:hypothetical protein POM88_023732 [Heracleum sosnowskyi]|uniref:F-box domain-containing protein n=1 Tax=Heracleum sosnowskyi TaxID=360622 RepID=A0AAD8MV82_9APIA|nr:hypothetical protein POM88_023732 [Heracleum sosnowskyi]